MAEVECLSIIEKLFEKYKDNEYMLQRLKNHVRVYLPNTLENESKNHEKRINLNNYLAEEQQIFIQVFLSKHNYYYISSNNFYYEYNGNDYTIVKEDEILHELLSSISKERTLLRWKHKTKSLIIKQIKDRHLFSCIPESETIQNVLNCLYPTFFQSKNDAKYFLTIIGDNILKKSTDNIFMVTSKLRQLMDELEVVVACSINNTNTINRFVMKYHDTHVFNHYRLIRFNEHCSLEYWRETLKKIGLNMICVAVHYSNRYTNSDGFLASKLHDDLNQYALTFKNSSIAALVTQFTNAYIETTTDTECTIEWRNLYFIWKQFLSSHQLPTVISSNQLRQELKNRYTYDKDADAFAGITSKYLPMFKDFIRFWETTMVTHATGDEMEIDEVCSLFKYWNGNKTSINEDTIIKAIKYFFSLEIVEDKYILNVRSTLWDKETHIKQSIPYITTQVCLHHHLALISFDDLYKWYQGYCEQSALRFVVSKRYFEKYMSTKYSDYIVYDKFIKIEYLSNF
ncbi:MAG: hypothetical protein ACOVRN_17190 [Flavobacterium sp.]